MSQSGAGLRSKAEVDARMSDVNQKYQELGQAIDALAGPPGPPGSPKNVYVYEAHRRLEEVAHRASDVYSFAVQATTDAAESAAAAVTTGQR